MDAEHWKRVEEIYNAILERNPDQREAYLKEACATDETLRNDVAGLLACPSDDRVFLECGAMEAAARILATDQVKESTLDLVGRTLSHYRMVEKIGEGGMGAVYRAHDEKLNRDVAIKVLPVEWMADPERKKRFLLEARTASALNHPNIISVYDIVSENESDFLIMEYVTGRTLDRKIEGKDLSMTELVKYATQIAEALAAAHGAGIIHRDLKPANIMVTESGLIKVLDFGLAKLMATEVKEGDGSKVSKGMRTEEGRILGTTAYMSPEQAEGRSLDARSDIFSFGSVLYEMVTGRRAFDKGTASATLAAVIRDDVDMLDIPGEISDVISRCLKKELNRRFQSMAEVRTTLLAIEEKRRTPATRWKWLMRLTIALVVGLGILTGWLWYRSSRERWALQTLTPKIAQLLEVEEFGQAAEWIREAKKILPNDPTLEKLWLKATGEAILHSIPSGAEVSIRSYPIEDVRDWTLLGKTPIDRIRIPKGSYLWRITKPGFAPICFLDGPRAEWLRLRGAIVTWRGTPQSPLNLIPETSVPPEMVVVIGTATTLGHPLGKAPTVKLDDYLIDRHEVTNEEYRRFMDAGGYQKHDFWKQPFILDGRRYSWEEAMRLFLDTTGRFGPATWEVGTFPKGMEKHPVAGVSWYEAMAYAEYAGKALPTIYHWTCAAQPLLSVLSLSGSNFSDKGMVPVGNPSALSGFGTTDMAGNVKEWCWNESWAGKRFIFGGGYGDPNYMFYQTDAQSPWHRRANFGFRCVKLFSLPKPATIQKIEPPLRDYLKENPVSDAIFQVFQGHYSYDKTELNARMEETSSIEGWIQERISFDAAYGGERMVAHLILPKNSVPPYQTVIFFPGANAVLQEKFDVTWIEKEDFLLKSGRAVMFPIYKGTFERRGDMKPGGYFSCTPALWRDYTIMRSKDLSRSIDYLQTRTDIDSTRLAYLGFSLGAWLAPNFLANEDRFRAAILASGGFYYARPLPEVDALNFVTRVKTPVLMLNGRYDDLFPLELFQVPFFRSLGTPDKDKKHAIYEAGHGNLPRGEEVRETLNWLDKYLGPVRH